MPRALCASAECSKHSSYGMAASRKPEFCSQHAAVGMIDVTKKQCGNNLCSKKPSYGVAGGRKTELCSQHAMMGMVNVVSKKCGNEGCSKKPMYGVAGSRKAECCSQHASMGMVDVTSKKCGNEGCTKQPSYGVAGSRKAEFCSQHAMMDMVNVVTKKCGNEGCSKIPSYGVIGSRKAEFCFEHAIVGMVNVVTKKCGNEGCSKIPSYGVMGSRKAKFCSQHATAGMIRVVGNKCGNEGCAKQPSYSMAGSGKAEFCSKHATTGMIRVVSRKCGNEGCAKQPSYGVAGSRKAEFCSQHAPAGMKHVGRKKKMEAVLAQNFVGDFTMKVSSLTCTTLARPTNRIGLARVERSVKDKGWLSQFAPSVLIAREVVPDGQLTSELALSIQARVLDGNHRVVVFRKVFGEEATLKVRVYFDFANATDEKLIADSFNDATESLAKRTIFDKLFFFNELMISQRNITQKGNLQPRDLRNVYKRVGAKCPTDKWLKTIMSGVTSLSPEAFDTIRELSETTADPGVVDSNTITFVYLNRPEFQALREQPTQQSLCLQVLARFRGFYNRSAKKEDWAGIDQHASQAAEFFRGVEGLVPRGQWTKRLKSCVAKHCYEVLTKFETWVKPHLSNIKQEIADRAVKLPAGQALDSDIADIIQRKPLGAVRKTLSDDSGLRPYLEEWEKQYDAALNKITLLGLQQTTAVNGGANGEANGDANGATDRDTRDDGDNFGGDEEESADSDGDDVAPTKGSRKGEQCTSCKAPATSSYFCVHCSITHCGSCRVATLAAPDQDEREKSRLCTVCRITHRGGSTPARKRRRGASAASRQNNNDGTTVTGGTSSASKRKRRTRDTITPSPSESPDDNLSPFIESSRKENAVLHDDLLPLSSDIAKGSSLPLHHPAMLTLVSIAADKSLLETTPHANTRLAQVVEAVCSSLHPSGTVAFLIPDPWHRHLGRISDALLSTTAITQIEDHHMIIEYASLAGERPAAESVNHPRRKLECLLIAHNKSAGGKGFTCNSRVTAADPYGIQSNSGPVAPALPLMLNVPYLGADTDFPERALQYLVNRFTGPGDTVSCVCGEHNRAVEVALSRGRRVEVFLADKAAKDGVQKRITSAFFLAHKEGKFRGSAESTKEVAIDLDRLPRALPPDTTPERVREAVANALERGKTKADAEQEVAEHVAETFGRDLKRHTYMEDDLLTVHGFVQESDNTSRGVTESGRGDVVDGRGRKRGYSDGTGSGPSDGTSSTTRRGGTMPPLLAGHTATGYYGVCRKAEARMKAELVVNYSNDKGCARQLGSTTLMVLEHPTAAVNGIESGEAETETNVKLEMGVSSPSR